MHFTRGKADAGCSIMQTTREIVLGNGQERELQRIEPYVDSVKAGDFLGLHPVTVMRLARQGHIPGHPLRNSKRKQWRFLLSELSDWLGAQSGM